MPHLATLLELKTRVRLSTIPKQVLHRERRDGGQSHLLEGLIFEASCTYSKISPHPSLGVWAMSTAKKERGGAYFQEDMVLLCYINCCTGTGTIVF